MSVTQTSPASAKIALFRALFRGREEVYPRRFKSAKSGKAGYSPVCGNEWVRGVCEKPRIKCSDCPHQRWLPVTDDVVRCHLSGVDDRGRDFVAGVYPMLLDERCFLLPVFAIARMCPDTPVHRRASRLYQSPPPGRNSVHRAASDTHPPRSRVRDHPRRTNDNAPRHRSPVTSVDAGSHYI